MEGGGTLRLAPDECGMADITKLGLGRAPYRPSKFEHMMICLGKCFVVKSSGPSTPSGSAPLGGNKGPGRDGGYPHPSHRCVRARFGHTARQVAV